MGTTKQKKIKVSPTLTFGFDGLLYGVDRYRGYWQVNLLGFYVGVVWEKLK